MLIGDHPRSPVPYGRGLHSHTFNIGVLTPAELMHLPESANEVLIAGLDHDRSARWNLAKGAQVGVVHVGVGQQDQVEWRQLSGTKGGFHETPGPHFREASSNSDSGLQGRVCQHQCATDIEQDACVPQPGNGQTLIRPVSRVRPMRSGLDVGRRIRTTLCQSSADVRPGEPQVVLERQGWHYCLSLEDRRR
jgi:hypothetical protein